MGKTKTKIPWAIREGELTIGSETIPCAVLDNGMRVLTQEGMLHSLGRAKKAKGGEGASVDDRPAFMRAANLKPFISEELDRSTRPLVYKPLSGGHHGLAYGCDATAFPGILKVYVKAQEAGALHPKQVHIAERAAGLLEALPKIGMIALVDEATGHQAERAHDELQKILEAYVLPEHRPWLKTIPREFTRELYRVWGWSTASQRGPRYAGKLTRKLLYAYLPPPVLPKLDQVNPADEKWQRRHRHHSYLTTQMGLEHFKAQLSGVMALLRASPNKRVFMNLFERAYGDQHVLDFGNIDEELEGEDE